MLHKQNGVTSVVVESTTAAIAVTDPNGDVSIAAAGFAAVQPFQQQEVGTPCLACHMADAGLTHACLRSIGSPATCTSSALQAAGHSTPCGSSPTEALHPGCHQDSVLCNHVLQAAAGVNHYDSMQQVHCSGNQQNDANQTPYEDGLQGSSIATPSTDGSFTPSSEFQAVYGGFYGGFYGCATSAPGVSGQATGSCSGSDAGPLGVDSGPPGLAAAGSVDSVDPEEEFLVLQEVTEEEVSI